MSTLGKTLEVGGVKYEIRRMPVSGLIAMMEKLAARPWVMEAMSKGEPVGIDFHADMADLYMTHCVTPSPLLRNLSAEDGAQLLSAAAELTPLADLFVEFMRFFAALGASAKDKTADAAPTP